ncbi:UNVERIFIED_CONTAM: hypothetical protein HDU68_011799 [Siphonaria sp. JEL0065]|nr:hypothetical protein HDU68_011799 [Siphonaria sp. JEL0065]
MTNILEQIGESFTKKGDYKGEKLALGAVAIAGLGYLGYEEWLKHHNKEHSEEHEEHFKSQVQEGYEKHPDYIAKYGDAK